MSCTTFFFSGCVMKFGRRDNPEKKPKNPKLLIKDIVWLVWGFELGTAFMVSGRLTSFYRRSRKHV